MKNFLLVFLGGGLGSVLRFLISRFINPYEFPYATLIANVAACFLLGIIVGIADHKQLIGNNSRLFWSVGFCGGFSTFSTFSNESLSLLNSGNQIVSVIYIVLSISLCLMAVFTGQWLMKH